MIEKVNQRVLSDINFNRAQWFNARWPLLEYQEPSKTTSNNTSFKLTKSSPLFISLPLSKPLDFTKLDWRKSPFIIEKRLPIPQLERNLANYTANPEGSFLAIKPLILSGNDTTSLKAKHIQLMIKAPEDLLPGTYSINLINNQTQEAVAALKLELLDIRLPALEKPVGVYLDLAPHLFLSYERKNKAEQQLMCDLKTLSSLGLTGISPPFPLPKNQRQHDNYQKRVTSLAALGFKPPYLDYTSLKNLRYQFGQDQTGQKLTQLATTPNLVPSHLAMSIADEPSNASSHGFDLKQMAALVERTQTAGSPSFLKAAHLNNPKDKRWLGDLDIALINQGYGVSLQNIQQIRHKKVKVWLYNMSHKRLAAGFFLWKHKVSGYLQWHARMPTADPYDPTDGREDDQQLLPVMDTLCAQVADLHPDMIEIAEGITDHKWLNWLDKESRQSIAAYRLRERLLKSIPNTWQRAEKITSNQLQTWRNDIEELALSIPK